jgi:hypothetical protein
MVYNYGASCHIRGYADVPLRCAASDIGGGRLFRADDTCVYGFDGSRILWKSPRVALDGIGGTTSHFQLQASTGESVIA